VSEKLEWVFEGVDKFTGPVGGMTGGVLKFAFGMNQAGEAIAGLIEGMAKVGEMGFEFGKFGLEALAFKEKVGVAFETILQSKEEGQKLFQQAIQLAEFSPFTAKDVAGGFQGLLAAGFTAEEIPIVFQSIGDAASFAKTTAEGTEMIDSLIRHFSRMKAAGVADTMDITHMIQQAAASGVKLGDIYTNIGAKMGMPVSEVANAIKNKLVPANTAIMAFMTATQKIAGGDVGGSMVKSTTTLVGLFATLKSRAEEVFFGMKKDVNDVTGISVLKSAMQNVADVFNILNPQGQAFSAALERMFGGAITALFGDFSGPGGLGGVEGALDKLIKWMNGIDWLKTFTEIKNSILSVTKVAWAFVSSFLAGLTPLIVSIRALFGIFSSGGGTDSMVMLAKVAGWVIGGLLGISVIMTALASPIFLVLAGIMAWVSVFEDLFDIDWSYIPEELGQLWDSIAGWFKKTWESFKTWGGDLIDGLIEGIIGKAASLGDTMGSLVDRMTGGFTSLLGIHSPSTLFAEYGGFTAEGFAQGVDGGQDDVNAAVMRLGAATPGATSGGPSSPTGSIQVNFGERAIVIEAAGMNTEELARRLKSLLASELVGVFEGLATEGGVG
jgi:hypothetical protein